MKSSSKSFPAEIPAGVRSRCPSQSLSPVCPAPRCGLVAPAAASATSSAETRSAPSLGCPWPGPAYGDAPSRSCCRTSPSPPSQWRHPAAVAQSMRESQHLRAHGSCREGPQPLCRVCRHAALSRAYGGRRWTSCPPRLAALGSPSTWSGDPCRSCLHTCRPSRTGC